MLEFLETPVLNMWQTALVLIMLLVTFYQLIRKYGWRDDK